MNLQEQARKIVVENLGRTNCTCREAFKGRGRADPVCTWCSSGKGLVEDITAVLEAVTAENAALRERLVEAEEVLRLFDESCIAGGRAFDEKILYKAWHLMLKAKRRAAERGIADPGPQRGPATVGQIEAQRKHSERELDANG